MSSCFDIATQKWFKEHVGVPTSLAKCNKCGLYYKPELGHQCKIARMTMQKASMEADDIQSYKEYGGIMKESLSPEVVDILKDRGEFAKWLERGKWNAKKCDALERELEQYKMLGTIEELKEAVQILNIAGNTGLTDLLHELYRYRELGTPEEILARFEDGADTLEKSRTVMEAMLEEIDKLNAKLRL